MRVTQNVQSKTYVIVNPDVPEDAWWPLRVLSTHDVITSYEEAVRLRDEYSPGGKIVRSVFTTHAVELDEDDPGFRDA